MGNSLQIGNVVEVRGTRIKVLVDKEMNHSTLIHQGEVINNITVNGFVLVKKGLVDIVGKIDAEYIEDLLNVKTSFEKDHRYNKGTISRILEIQVIGFFESDKFQSGVRHLPMIGNISYIPTKQNVNEIYAGNRLITQFSGKKVGAASVCLGKSIFENINIDLPINPFYASHIGIFGNTGSGKSNTLAKLYFELFQTINLKKIKAASLFHVIDFNGEYAHDGVFGLPDDQINILDIGSRSSKYETKIKITEDYFYNGDLLSILFNAREQTQIPFIKRLLKSIKNANQKGWTIANWLPYLYGKSLTNSNKEVFEYMKSVIDYLMVEINYENTDDFQCRLNQIEWWSKDGLYFVKSSQSYFNSVETIKTTLQEQSGFKDLLSLCSEIKKADLNWFSNFVINSKLQLVSDMLSKYAQFEHINPLIHRIESKVKELDKSIEITNTADMHPLVTVYSFRECSTDLKKMIPTIIVKSILDNHKSKTNQERINKTVHIIIDEAHNILNPQFDKDGTDWHDYRLEVFEEIIKEGRKFGVFLTISSQRPSDISSTIISQVHNYFIHRLVNNKDLEMIDNAISTLDRVTKNSIPTLASGSCIVTGTALAMPIFMQVGLIKERSARPNSDNINLIELWNKRTFKLVRHRFHYRTKNKPEFAQSNFEGRN